jgi:hypothetical protein
MEYSGSQDNRSYASQAALAIPGPRAFEEITLHAKVAARRSGIRRI